MSPHNQLIACVIKQYGTGLYRAWISLDRGHVACLGAHQDEEGATETINRFLEIYRDEQVKKPEDVLTCVSLNCAQDLTVTLSIIERSVGEMAA